MRHFIGDFCETSLQKLQKWCKINHKQEEKMRREVKGEKEIKINGQKIFVK
jgi:hypothetical protein